MKNIIILIVVYVVLFTILVALIGCVSNGQGGYRLTFGAADKIDKGIQAGAEGLSLLSLFIPGLAGVSAAAAGIAGTFKKMKPKLTKQKKATQHVVSVIEEIKKGQPEWWEANKDKFKVNDTDIEDIVDEIIEFKKKLDEAKSAG